jgi:hypothetical protein
MAQTRQTAPHGAWARATRKGTDELGTVVEWDGEIKVKWDDGKTSYYRNQAR